MFTYKPRSATRETDTTTTGKIVIECALSKLVYLKSLPNHILTTVFNLNHY
jgi:hypothetical protein